MEINISIGGVPDGAPLTALFRWLGQDPDVRRDVKMSIASAPVRPGDMGGGLELLNVVLSNGIALSSLVVAVASWIGTRGGRGARDGFMVRIERDGVTVTISEDSPEAVRRVLRVLDGDAGEPE